MTNTLSPTKRNGLYFLNKDETDYILPSVTSITSEAMPKPGLLYWAAKTAARAALHDPTLSEEQAAATINNAKVAGGDRGSLIHGFTEASDNGHQPDINQLPVEIQGYARAYQKFIAELKPKLILNEKKIVNFTHGYAGRLDRIYEVSSGLVVADFKTSANYYPENGLQLAAYSHAEFYFEDGNGPFTPMPKITGSIIVLLGVDGSYTLKHCDEPLEVFLNLKAIWMWLNKDKFKK